MIRWIALNSWALMPFDIAGSTAGSSQNFASPLAQKKNRYGPSLNTVGLTCVSIVTLGPSAKQMIHFGIS